MEISPVNLANLPNQLNEILSWGGARECRWGDEGSLIYMALGKLAPLMGADLPV